MVAPYIKQRVLMDRSAILRENPSLEQHLKKLSDDELIGLLAKRRLRPWEKLIIAAAHLAQIRQQATE